MNEVILIPKPRKIERLPTDFTKFLVQRKINGAGCIIKGGGKGLTDIHLYSPNTASAGKHIEYSAKLLHIVTELTKLNIAKDSLLYGELFYERRSWTRYARRPPRMALELSEDPGMVTSILNTTASRLTILEQERIELILLDLYKWGGKDLTCSNENRWKMLEQYINWTDSKYVCMIENINPPNPDALLRKIVPKLGSSKWEGVVLKLKDGKQPYQIVSKPKSIPRSHTQFKYVANTETDVIVTGYRLSKLDPKRVASLEMCQIKGDKLIYVGHCNAIGEAVNELGYGRGREPTLPYVAAIQYRELTKHGMLKNAIYFRRRWDKNWEDCVVEEEKK